MSEDSLHRVDVPSPLKTMLQDFYGIICPHCGKANVGIYYLNDHPRDGLGFVDLVPFCDELDTAALLTREAGSAAATGLVETLQLKAKELHSAPDSRQSYPLAYLCNRVETYLWWQSGDRKHRLLALAQCLRHLRRIGERIVSPAQIRYLRGFETIPLALIHDVIIQGMRAYDQEPEARGAKAAFLEVVGSVCDDKDTIGRGRLLAAEARRIAAYLLPRTSETEIDFAWHLRREAHALLASGKEADIAAKLRESERILERNLSNERGFEGLANCHNTEAFMLLDKGQPTQAIDTIREIENPSLQDPWNALTLLDLEAYALGQKGDKSGARNKAEEGYLRHMLTGLPIPTVPIVGAEAMMNPIYVLGGDHSIVKDFRKKLGVLRVNRPLPKATFATVETLLQVAAADMIRMVSGPGQVARGSPADGDVVRIYGEGSIVLKERLGAGKAGTVFVAEALPGALPSLQGLDNRTLAVKFYSPAILELPNQDVRLKREADISRRVLHPNVLRTYGLADTGRGKCLLMKYIRGETLRKWIRETGDTAETSASFCIQLLAGLAALHNAGLIHRDLKPENILLPEDKTCLKIADFGVLHDVTQPTVTPSDQFLGTIRYAAPEYLFDGRASFQSDQYSAGAIMYEIMNGVPLIEEEGTFANWVLAVREAKCPTLDKFAVHSHGDIIRTLVVRTLLEREPGDRFMQTSDAFSLFSETLESPLWKDIVPEHRRRFSREMVSDPISSHVARQKIDVAGQKIADLRSSGAYSEALEKAESQLTVDQDGDPSPRETCPVCGERLVIELAAGGELCYLCGYLRSKGAADWPAIAGCDPSDEEFYHLLALAAALDGPRGVPSAGRLATVVKLPRYPGGKLTI